MANLEGMDLGTCVVLRQAPNTHNEDAYVVRHAFSGEQATVRIVHATLDPATALASPEMGSRFAQDASGVAGLEQPNILPVHAYGERAGIRYVIMPDVPDGSLADYLAPGSGHLLPFTLSVAAAIAGQAAAALQHAHERGVIHSTVNLHTVQLRRAPRSSFAGKGMEAEEPQIALTDFGLSQYLPGSSLAAPRVPVLDCLAPEQREGRAVPASDQYALACVLYLLLVGQPVATGGPTLPPSRLNPALPRAVDTVFETALSGDPAERFPRVVDLATALWTALRPAAYAQRSPVVVSVPTAGTRTSGGLRGPQQLGSFASGRETDPADGGFGQRAGAASPAIRRAPLGAARIAVDPREEQITRRRALMTLGALGAAGVAALGGGYYAWRHHLFGSATPLKRTSIDLGIATGYDGIGLYRPAAFLFTLVESWKRGGPTLAVTFGNKGDVPLVGDWNGDGIASVGVFRPSTGQFLLKDSNASTAPLTYSVAFGQAGDIPIAGDWTGKGRDGIGVFRPSAVSFFLKNTLDAAPPDIIMTLGTRGDMPLAGDWDGDGVSGLGVYRPSEDRFYLVNTLVNNGTGRVDYSFSLKTGPGLAFAGRWNAVSKRAGVGIKQANKSTVFLKDDVTTTRVTDAQFVLGEADDIPLAGRWAR